MKLWVKRLVLLLVLLLIIAIGLSALHYASSAERIHDFLQNKWWVFAIWRYSLLAVLMWQWSKICRWFGKKKQISNEVVEELIKRRWVVLAFIVLFEVVFVYGV